MCTNWPSSTSRLMAYGSHGLTTYKELCSLASDLNQPDLVYKFMNLANHHAMWNSRKVSCSCIILTNLFPGQYTCQFSFHLLKLSFHLTWPPFREQLLVSTWSQLRPESSWLHSCPSSYPVFTATSLTPTWAFARPWPASGMPWSLIKPW